MARTSEQNVKWGQLPGKTLKVIEWQMHEEQKH